MRGSLSLTGTRRPPGRLFADLPFYLFRREVMLRLLAGVAFVLDTVHLSSGPAHLELAAVLDVAEEQADGP